MAKSGMRRKKPGKYTHTSKATKLLIAKALVRDLPTKTLKQIAFEFNITYSLLFKILQEYVEVTKTFKLREARTEAENAPGTQVPDR